MSKVLHQLWHGLSLKLMKHGLMNPNHRDLDILQKKFNFNLGIEHRKKRLKKLIMSAFCGEAMAKDFLEMMMERILMIALENYSLLAFIDIHINA